MTGCERPIAKMPQLPEPRLPEVSDLIDILLIKQDQTQWEFWMHFREALDVADADCPAYSRNVDTDEVRLARGDIQW